MKAVTSEPYQSADTHHRPAQSKQRVRDEVKGGQAQIIGLPGRLRKRDDDPEIRDRIAGQVLCRIQQDSRERGREVPLRRARFLVHDLRVPVGAQMKVMVGVQGAIAAIGQEQRPPGQQVRQKLVQRPVMREGAVRAVMPQQREAVLPVADDQNGERVSGRVVPESGQDDGADHDRPVEQGVFQPRPDRPFVENVSAGRGLCGLCGAGGPSRAFFEAPFRGVSRSSGYFFARK